MSLDFKDKKLSKKSIKHNISKYIKDNVFDNFDISDLIKKDLYIPKTDLSNFLYQEDINSLNLNLNLTSTSTDDNSQPEKIQEEIISEINVNNHFNIELEKLKLTFKNGYEVPFINLYTPIKLIGEGRFGLVLSAIDIKTNKKMAVKIIKKKNYSDDFYLSETNLLKKLNHERIIKLYDVINTEQYLFIFTELCEGGSLKDYIISRYNSNNNYFIKDSECATIIKNIIQGVEYLVNNGIIHRDLKPENIMFRKENDINSLVICDLGLAKEIENNSFIESKCGTLIFMAPEVIMNKKYDSLIDIWSIGIIMYILESGGKHPLYEKALGNKHFIELIKNKNKVNFPSFFPTVARNFFLKLCKYDPFFRYNVNRALNHPWIIRINHKIPLTVIEDIEKQDKIKNFKNMLISFIYLKQLKNFYKIREKNKTIKKCKTLFKDYNININSEHNKKLNTPTLKLAKYDIFFKNIKEESNLVNLPLLQKPLSIDNINKKNYTSKSNRNINYFKNNIKPNDLFNNNEKKNKLKRIKSNIKYFNNNYTIKSQQNISFQRNPNNNDLIKQIKSLIKNNNTFDNNINILKFNNKGRKIRLLSSKNVKEDNTILNRFSLFSKMAFLMTNEKNIKKIYS